MKTRILVFLLILVVLVIIGTAVSASAQSPAGYQFDNFDMANGVKVQTPPAAKKSRRSIRATTANWTPELRAPLTNDLSSNLNAATSMPVAGALDGFTTGNSEVDSFIVESGTRHGVDPLLLYAIMHQESTFKSRAISPKGARGLMQLMPGTAARYGVSNMFDARQNIEGGTRYMKFLLDLFDGDVSLALAGYNAGEGAVMKYGYRVPPYAETQEYVRRIGRRYSLMRDPATAQYANQVSSQQVAAVRAKEATPLSIYERNVSAVRLPNGRLQLMSQ